MITPETLSAVAGVILSLVFMYVPGLNTKYAALTSETKRLIMLGLLFATAASAFGLSCAGVLTDLFGATVTCDREGLLGLIQVFIYAVMANQAAYLISPQPHRVKAAKIASASFR